MDAGAIMSAIATVGFPCAMCVVLLVQMQEQSKLHKDEISALTKYLNENTLTIQKLADRLEVHYENVRTWHSPDKEI